MGKKVHKIYKNPDWINWVGCEIVKHSNKPFKNGLKVGVVKELTTNPYSNKVGFLMYDGSIVDCQQCKLAPQEYDLETGGLEGNNKIYKNGLERLTRQELEDKYRNIEDKIPSFWKTWEEAGINLAQDLSFGHWDISEDELYRVISLVSQRVKGVKITQHLDPKWAYKGLYPHIMKPFDITPDVMEGGFKKGEMSVFFASAGHGKSQFRRETPSIEDIENLLAKRDKAEKEARERGDMFDGITIVDYPNLLDPERAAEVTESGRGHMRKISEIMAEFMADLKAKGKQTMIVPKGIGKTGLVDKLNKKK